MGDPEHGRPDGCAVVICNGDEGYVVFLQFDELDAHCLRSFKRMEVGKVCAFLFFSDLMLKTDDLMAGARQRAVDRFAGMAQRRGRHRRGRLGGL
jgi:hypothetical protein